MVHGGFVFLELEVFGIDLDVHSFDLFSFLIEGYLSFLDLFFPLLVVPTVFIYFLVEFLLCLLENDL